MTRIFKLFIPLFSLIISFYHVNCQTDNYYFYQAHEAWEGSLSFGVNSFHGDVNDNSNKIFPATPFQASFYKNRHFVLGGYFGKRLTPFWTVAFEFKLEHVSGAHKNHNLAFISFWNNELMISTTLDILSMCNLNTNWSVYPKIGVGLYGYKTKLWNTIDGSMMNNYPMDPYHYTFGLPFGIGAGYRILPELRVYFETGFTWVAGDALDGQIDSRRNFEAVWNTMIGVSYQFDFPPVNAKANPRSNTANDALKDDGVTKKYKKMRWKSNLGTGKPRYSKSSSMKKH